MDGLLRVLQGHNDIEVRDHGDSGQTFNQLGDSAAIQQAGSAASVAFEQLCTDFPEVSDDGLTTLIEHLHGATSMVEFPLCTALVAGLEYGATRQLPSAAPPQELEGLVCAPALPSRFAEAYAVGCVRRACLLLSLYIGRRTADLSAALSSYHPPQAQPADGPAQVPEIYVPKVTDEEVWAADLDDDNQAYEPIGQNTMELSASSQPRLPKRIAKTHALAFDELEQRLYHLIGSLSHSPLASLAPGAWESLQIGSTLLEAITTICAPDIASQHLSLTSTEPGNTLHGGAADRTIPIGAAHSPSIGAPVFGPLISPLVLMLRDHFWHDPLSCASELRPTLDALPGHQRHNFLALLVSDNSCFATIPDTAWSAIDAEIQTALPLLAHHVSATSPSEEAGRGDGTPLELYVQLVDWYLVGSCVGRVGVSELMFTIGAPQLLLQLVLLHSATIQLVSAWKWLHRACCLHRPLLLFTRQVPTFFSAVRCSAYLVCRRAELLSWLWLLAAARECLPHKTTAADSDSEICAEAEVRLAMLAAEARDEGAIEPLLVMNELLDHQRAAVGCALSAHEMLCSKATTPLTEIVRTLGLHVRQQIAERRGTGSKGGEDSGARARAADEKQYEVLQRVAHSLKLLLQTASAPGKAD